MEVMIATVILVLMLSSVFALLNRAVATNVDNKKRIMALSLAREGIEGVRNIRDTNWLQFSGSRRRNWLCLEVANDGSCSERLAEGYYALQYDGVDYTLTQTVDTVGVRQGVLDLFSPENFREYMLYESTDPYLLTLWDGGIHAKSATPFFRQIEFRFENVCGFDVNKNDILEVGERIEGIADTTPQACEQGAVRAIVRVGWMSETTAPQSVVLETQLFDFYERDAYDH